MKPISLTLNMDSLPHKVVFGYLIKTNFQGKTNQLARTKSRRVYATSSGIWYFQVNHFGSKIFLSPACRLACYHRAAIIGHYADDGRWGWWWWADLCIWRVQRGHDQKIPANLPSASASRSTHDHSSGQSRTSVLLEAHQPSAGHTTPGGNGSSRCVTEARGDQVHWDHDRPNEASLSSSRGNMDTQC